MNLKEISVREPIFTNKTRKRDRTKNLLQNEF